MRRMSLDLLCLLIVLCLPLALFTRYAEANKLMRVQPASGTALSYVCIDAWQGIKACVPRSALFGRGERRDLYPPIEAPAGASVSYRALTLIPLKRDGCNTVLRRHGKPRLAQVLFGSRFPEMRLGFENFELDMDVHADMDGLRFEGIHLGYRNCWW